VRHLNLLLILIGIVLLILGVNRVNAVENELYKIGADDVLEIKVIDHPNLSTVSKVSGDGSISFPYLGVINVRDMTLPEIKKKITESLSDGYVKYPEVTVSLVQSMSRRVFSYGEVTRRGEIPFEENMTLLKTLSLIGGVSQKGLFGKLIVRRKPIDSNIYRDILITNLNNGFIENQEIENTPLNTDDILIVKNSDSFLLEGEAVQRGRMVLETDMTVLRSLSQSGGVTENGRYGTVRIRRKQAGESGEYKDIAQSKLNDGTIESKEVEEMVLQPDDIVLVERNKTVLIQGEVVQRGRMVLETDMTVLESLLQAGGVTDNGLYGNLVIRRKHEGGMKTYRDIVESRLNEGTIVNRDVENMLLYADDVIIVEKSKSYFIYGEAKNTGEFVLKNNMTVFKAITIVGGMTKWGSEGRIKVLRMNDTGDEFRTIKVDLDDIIDGDALKDVILQPGDIIIASSGLL
jgi:polysaccharide export outer membrane protein